MLERFQQATVDAAVERLFADGPRRFLVADEVGLGKTLVAREIARRLPKGRGARNVLYLCPNLQIAAQNRGKFISLTGIDEGEYHGGEDRLSLMAVDPPQESEGFRILGLTPDTSLPGWRATVRTGRKREREIIVALLNRHKRLLARLRELDSDRDAAPLLPDPASETGLSQAAFDSALGEIFGGHGRLERRILEWLDLRHTGIAEFIVRARAAMALATLRAPRFRPGLVILDEFHRYADLILPSSPPDPCDRLRTERWRVQKLLVDALLRGDKRYPAPAVLLLSATPYRLRRLSGEDIHPADRYRALTDLVGFLKDDPRERADFDLGMREYQEALAAEGDSQTVITRVRLAKSRLEQALRPVVARTERALVCRDELFDRPEIPVEIAVRDLQLFRHLAQATSSSPAHLRGWAPALWSSVPYPAQTLHGYALWGSIVKSQFPPVDATVRAEPAHPQMRALASVIGDPSQLALPWQPPTLGWWRLEGPWSRERAAFGKTLLFSRWRAAPNAISALTCLPMQDARLVAGKRASPGLLRPGGSDASALLAIFTPWPRLSLGVERPGEPGLTLGAVRKRAVADLQRFLVDHGIRIEGKGKRPTWEVACAIERQLGAHIFNRLARTIGYARIGGNSSDWKAVPARASISSDELAALASHLLAAPGPILARCASRHGINVTDRRSMERLFRFGWNQLRSYLGHRTFVRLILRASRKTRYPDALCEAMLKGCFEAVLDEQLCILALSGGHRGPAIIDELAAGVLHRPSRVRLRTRRRQDATVSVQAAIPFSGGEQTKVVGNRLRSDAIRKAFNSPFWPHVLSTTSIGQEGLDFHQWCGRIVHWDLPTDPVEFEQREGRIARYGSIRVRQALAHEHGDEALRTAGQSSPFARLLTVAGERRTGRTGLETWWIAERTKPQSITFSWKFSIRAARKQVMLENLLYYRLGLGQPEPSAFMAMLKRICADAEIARGLAINLAPIGRLNLDTATEERAGALTPMGRSNFALTSTSVGMQRTAESVSADHIVSARRDMPAAEVDPGSE